MTRQRASGQEPARLGTGILVVTLVVTAVGMSLVVSYMFLAVRMLSTIIDRAAILRAFGAE